MEKFSLQPFGKLLVITGIIIAIIGLVLIFMAKIPIIGKLPGDIIIKHKKVTFYFPVTTLLLINIVLWLFIWLIKKFSNNS